MISELYVMRFPLVEIWRRVNELKTKEKQISISQIQKDISIIRQEWRDRKRENIDTYLNEVLDVLDATHREAYGEWLRSKRDHERRIGKQKTGGANGSTEEKSLMQEGQTGDPRYLAIVMQAIERKCKLLGLDAPTKITGPDGEGVPLAVTVTFTDVRPDELNKGE